MNLSNPIHKAIYDNVVRKALDDMAFDTDAVISKVDYYAQRVDVFWKDKDGRERTALRVEIPKDADGIYRQSIKVGDTVRLAFKNGNHNYPYITMIYRNSTHISNFLTKKGSSIPKGIGYM